MTARRKRITIDVPWAEHRKPNRITVKAIKQTLAGKNLKKFETLDELIEDLEK